MKRCATIVLLGGLLLSTCGAVAAAEIGEGTYPEGGYREQVEPICKTMSERAAAPFSPSALTKGYPPTRAGALLTRAGRALLWGHRVLAAIVVPPEVQGPVGEWVTFVGATAARYLKAARALAQGHQPKARHLLRGLKVPAKVERTEDALHFAYCKIEPRRWVAPIRNRAASAQR
jgi:hypothetical protein